MRAKYGETLSYTTTPYYWDVPDTNAFFQYIQKVKDDTITTTIGAYKVSSDVSRETGWPPSFPYVFKDIRSFISPLQDFEW